MFQHREKQFQAVYIYASLEISDINFKQCFGSGLDSDCQLGRRIRTQAGQKKEKGFNFMFEESYITVFGPKNCPNMNFLQICHNKSDPDLDPDWIRIQQQAGSGYGKIPGPDPDSVNTATNGPNLVYRLPNSVLPSRMQISYKLAQTVLAF